MVPKKLIGDPLRISQVLLNICSNAIKFTVSGLVSVKIEYAHETEKLKFEIRDTGIGMSPEQAAQVFESFTQADGSTSRRFGGTGLGLSIVKQLCTLMDGDVSVESIEEEGSCFYVELKTPSDESASQLHPIDTNLPIYYASSQESALLSDDYFSALSIKPEHLTLDELETSLEKANSDSVALIDAHNYRDIEKHTKVLKKLNRDHVKLCFIMDIQPEETINKICWEFDASVLSHPFSTRQLQQFLVDLLEKQEHQTQGQANEDGNQTQQFSGHVLLVEDNPVNQIVAQQMIELAGLSCDLAENGAEAVKAVTSETSYDLVLMDVQMPVMDGYEATQKIRELGYSELVICGLSANAMKQDKEKAEAAGMTDYLTKPIESEKLTEIFIKYLAS
jgi:CheY-like chemotaxis protein/anti-sigma regulatory factor (Ser/Thr protein kinase)